MGVLLKKTGCGVPQKYLRDAALFQKVGSGRAAVGAEFSAPTAAVLLSCRSVVLPLCRPVAYIKDQSSPLILAAAKKILIPHVVVFLRRQTPCLCFSEKNNKK